jgi:hypothetical protein
VLDLLRHLPASWTFSKSESVTHLACRPVNNKLVTLYTDLCGDMRGEHHKANFDVRVS